MRPLSFSESIGRLEGLLAAPALPAKVVGLRRVERLLAELGNPHRAFRSILIAGSSGKGSTTAMVASVMQASGHRTGVFRSPHLWSYRERISVDGTDISETEWEDCATRVWPVVEKMISGSLPGYDLGRPGFFEVLFALAALYFSQRQVEWATVEVGMGGRLDATNTLEADVAVVTTVSLEHTQILGRTVSAIAGEKAGIIKAGAHAVLGPSDADTAEVVRMRAEAVGAELLTVPTDVAVSVQEHIADRIKVRLDFDGSNLSAMLSHAGSYQAANAATAVAVFLALRRRHVRISEVDMKVGLERVQVPGRFELISGTPPVLLDGAHHAAAARAFRSAFDDGFPNCRFVLLFAAMADKNASEMAKALGPGADHVVVTRVPGSPRSGSPDDHAVWFRQLGVDVTINDDASQAFCQARTLVPPGGVLIVCGSLYLVGLARHLLLEPHEQ